VDLALLFSIPVYFSKTNLTDEDINFVMEQEYKRMDRCDGFITINKRLLNTPQLKNLKEKINKHIQVFMYEKLKVSPKMKFKILNSWGIKLVKGDYALSHNHANSLISGIMYLKTTEKGGSLTFHKNSSWHNIFPPCVKAEYVEYNLTTGEDFTVVPKPGSIILFPSSLNHSVAQNQSDEDRYSLAFNIYTEANIGTEKGTNELSIKVT